MTYKGLSHTGLVTPWDPAVARKNLHSPVGWRVVAGYCQKVLHQKHLGGCFGPQQIAVFALT